MGTMLGLPQLRGALVRAGRKGLVLGSSGWLLMMARMLTAGAGRVGQQRLVWTSPERAESPAPGASLRVDERPGALPKAKALGTEVLGVATCRGREGRDG